MDPAKEMNEIRIQMVTIARLLSNEFPHFEMKRKCPWCGRKTLLMRERDTHYWCKNPECGAEGDLDELEQFLLEQLMKKPRGVEL